jgi:ribosomal protein L11 methyltransferase
VKELVFDVALQEAEALSDALIELGALSVSVEDADRESPDEQPLFGEPGLEPERLAWERNRVVALVDAETDPQLLAAAAANRLGWNATPFFEVRPVPDQDWVRLTQSQFEPIPVSERLWIVPSWHEVPAEPGRVIIELDPGLAFGTGSHPTTRLCLRWIEAQAPAGLPLLDYGCGSGILAIAARKLGAGRTVGIDIDPQAVEAARANAERNGVEAEFGLPDAFADLQADVVVANILSNPLKLMAPMLSHRVRPGGRLALSGVLARQAEDVAAAYAPFIALSVWAEDDGWVCLHGIMRA